MTGGLRKLNQRTAMMLLANSLLYDIIPPTVVEKMIHFRRLNLTALVNRSS